MSWQAELSYSYWAAKSGEYKSTPEAKLLSEEEARRRAQEISRHVEQTGASAWNTVRCGLGTSFDASLAGNEALSWMTKMQTSA